MAHISVTLHAVYFGGTSLVAHSTYWLRELTIATTEYIGESPSLQPATYLREVIDLISGKTSH